MRVRTFILILFTVLTTLPAYAQYSAEVNRSVEVLKDASYYDSARLFKLGEELITHVKGTADKSAVAEVHLYYGNYCCYIRNFTKAEQYFKQARKEADENHEYHIHDLASIRLAYLDAETGEKNEAEREMDSLLMREKERGDFRNVAELLNLIGINKENNNKAQEAAGLYLQGLTLSESKGMHYYAGVFHNNLGLLKYFTGQNKEAMEDFRKGMEQTGLEKNKRLASHIQSNMCMVYVAEGKYKEANELFSEVIAYSRTNKLPEELASAYINFGSAFQNVKKTPVALLYMDSAIAVLQAHNLDKDLFKAYLGKTDILLSSGNTSEAIRILKEAEHMTVKQKNPDDLASYHLTSYRIAAQQLNYKKALEEYLEYSHYRDSSNTILNNKAIAEMQLKYNIQKKEAEIEKERSRSLQLEASNQKERFMRGLTIELAVILLILLTAVAFQIYFRKVRQQQALFSRQLIENIEDERKRIAQDLHDDVGQSLSIIKSRIVTGNLNKSDLTAGMETELSRVIEQTRQIARTLYPSHLTQIGLVRSIASLLENVQHGTRIQCSYDCTEEAEKLPLELSTHLFRIIQECTHNTIKHADATALKVSLQEKNGNYQLIYQDNGTGLKSNGQKNGLGLLSIQERAKIIHGQVSFDDKASKGFKLTIQFNAKKNASL
ncbi:MAG: histidine kinase [Bacteroidia bacterium]